MQALNTQVLQHPHQPAPAKQHLRLVSTWGVSQHDGGALTALTLGVSNLLAIASRVSLHTAAALLACPAGLSEALSKTLATSSWLSVLRDGWAASFRLAWATTRCVVNGSSLKQHSSKMACFGQKLAGCRHTMPAFNKHVHAPTSLLTPALHVDGCLYHPAVECGCGQLLQEPHLLLWWAFRQPWCQQQPLARLPSHCRVQ